MPISARKSRDPGSRRQQPCPAASTRTLRPAAGPASRTGSLVSIQRPIPAGLVMHWYRMKFVLPFMEKRERETRFVPARVSDNASTIGISTGVGFERLAASGLAGW